MALPTGAQDGCHELHASFAIGAGTNTALSISTLSRVPQAFGRLYELELLLRKDFAIFVPLFRL